MAVVPDRATPMMKTVVLPSSMAPPCCRAARRDIEHTSAEKESPGAQVADAVRSSGHEFGDCAQPPHRYIHFIYPNARSSP